MMHITPEGNLRYRQSMPGRVNITFGGAEANVAVSLALFGHQARFVTSLPKNNIVDALLSNLRAAGVELDHINFTDHGRLGIYFSETGLAQRPSQVVYDREGSSISLADPEDYNFEENLKDVTWVHFTGITPSLSENAYKACVALVQKARDKKIPVSCDLNFRKKLWQWRPGTKPSDLARECLTKLLPFIDIVIANEEDAENVLGIRSEGTDVKTGKLNIAGYEDVARKITKNFPNIKKVAITLRESISASHNRWGGMIFDAEIDKVHFAPLDEKGSYKPYEIKNIIDRVGGGDSFGAGLIHVFNDKNNSSAEYAIRFAVAASCLKHSIAGDFNYVSQGEVESLMSSKGTGRIQR